jgi:hypothetical protein
MPSGWTGRLRRRLVRRSGPRGPPGSSKSTAEYGFAIRSCARRPNELACENPDDNTIEGVNGDGTGLAPLPVAAHHRPVAQSPFDESHADVLHLYAANARDRSESTSEASFRDAVHQHELIDQIVCTSAGFFR